MFEFLFLLIVAAFIAMLFVNVFYRVKIFKVYKYLVQNRVDFTTKHFFNSEKLEKEILSKYPEHKTQILNFVTLIKKSVTLASVLIFIILSFGYLLMKFR